MPQEKHDCLTAQQYWEQAGDRAEDRPTPWWMVMGLPEPEAPRRLRRRATAERTPPRPEGERRRRLVRVGRQNAATSPRSATAPATPPGGP